jgi:PIN domain nuclease of toxin-antitoxin system
VIHLDTHVVIWLYGNDRERLSEAAQSAINEQAPSMSPMVELELAYLYEIKRIAVGPDQIVGALHADIGLTIAHDSWSAVVHRATDLTWTRDPFDRLIAAHALCARARLITHDEHLRLHLGAHACW